MGDFFLNTIKIKSIVLLLFLVCLLFLACTRNKFTQYDANYSYFLKYKSPSTEVLANDQIIIYHMQLAKANDSIFWDSQYFTEESFSFILNTKHQKSNFEKLISESFSIKDSITLQCNATALFNDFFKKSLPRFLKSNELIKAEIWIDTILQPNAFESYKAKQMARFNKTSERAAISGYLKFKPHTFYKNANIYIVKLNSGTGESIKKGDHLSIKYKGYFLNGTSCDNNGGNAIDFEYGEQAQLLPGLMRALSVSKYDDSLSVIIPSALAYGDSGSSDGFIKPFTALRYEIHIKKLN